MKVYIGGDHAGYELKERIIAYLLSQAYPTEDLGTYSAESTDYPEYAHAVAEAVGADRDALGVLICGSANGVAMTANKHSNVRCAICWNAELASLARQHNDANILALPARFISVDEAVEITEAFFNASFEGGRHKRRVDKIACG